MITNRAGATLTILAGAVCAGSAPGQTTFFTEQFNFETAAQQAGKAMKGIETFEESTAPVQSKTFFPNPLQNGVPQPHFPLGIDETNLIIQTNITPSPAPLLPNPSTNPNALWVNGTGFIGSNSIKVGTDEFLNSLFSSIDIIFPAADKTAVGLDASVFSGFAAGHSGFTLSAFDSSNNLLGLFFVPPGLPEPNKSFMGVLSTTPIGRVNVWGHFSVPQPFAVDDIQMWVVPAPGSIGLALTLGCVASRRRR
jgi:hypothetical protein